MHGTGRRGCDAHRRDNHRRNRDHATETTLRNSMRSIKRQSPDLQRNLYVLYKVISRYHIGQ